MKIYEKPDVEFVTLVSKEEVASQGPIEGEVGLSSFSIFG